jgi:hypothetical protein
MNNGLGVVDRAYILLVEYDQADVFLVNCSGRRGTKFGFKLIWEVFKKIKRPQKIPDRYLEVSF